MERLKNNEHVIYDAQMIIYYCFLYKKHRILELTNKTRKLTNYLINNNISIIVPESIIIELKKKTIGQIISEYTLSGYPTKIVGLNAKPTASFEYNLEKKVKKNFNKMINSNWFKIKPFTPKESVINLIEDFFKNIGDEEKLKEFLAKKRREDPVPSYVDMGLISFSKEMKSPLISNDQDITFFADELYEQNLSDKIYALMELDIYNN